MSFEQRAQDVQEASHPERSKDNERELPIETANQFFEQPEPGLFIITKFSGPGDSEKLISKYEKADPNSQVPFFHGSRMDLAGTIKILTSASHGVTQGRNKASFSVDPRSGYWTGGGLVYLIPRRETAFSSEERAEGAMAVGDDGLASLVDSTEQEALPIPIYDHKAYLAYGQTFEGEISPLEREAVIAINASLDEARERVAGLRTALKASVLDFASSCREIIPESTMHEIEGLLNVLPTDPDESKSRFAEASKAMAGIETELSAVLSRYEHDREQLVVREAANKIDRDTIEPLLAVQEFARENSERIYKISKKNGLRRFFGSAADDKAITETIAEVVTRIDKIEMRLSTGGETPDGPKLLFFKKFTEAVEVARDSIRERATAASIALANLEYDVEVYIKDTGKRELGVGNDKDSIDRGTHLVEMQLETFRQHSGAILRKREELDEEMVKIIADQDAAISREGERLRNPA